METMSSGSKNTNIAELVEALIKDNSVIVFSKSYCPYCSGAKRLLTEEGIQFHSIELDTRSDGSLIQEHLLKLTKQKTVPNTFIKEKHIGGYSDLRGLKSSGELYKLLK